MDYAAIPKERVLKELSTSLDGLSMTEASRRLERYGLNKLEEARKISWFKIFLSQFTSILVIILIIATIISALLGEFLDAIAILIILVINAILGTLQEYKAENAIEALKKLSSPKATVIRSGHRIIIDAERLVPGDIVVLEEGMSVPADIRIVEGHGLMAMEAVLTGESNPVSKDDKPVSTKILGEKKCILFKGTSIVKGYGLGVVIATGSSTELGRIAKNVGEMKRVETHLERKLSGLGKTLGVVTLGIALLVFLLYGLIVHIPLIQALMVGISLAVAAIPEGLPAVVTISLSLGAKRMAKKKALMRRLASIETLGAVTVICTDKTGTLTKNELTVKKIYDGISDIDVGGTGYTPLGSFSRQPDRKLLLAGVLSSCLLYTSPSPRD